MSVVKIVYIKAPGERAFKKRHEYVYNNRSYDRVCLDQYNYFEKGSKNRIDVKYSNFGSIRTATRYLPNGAKIKTVLKERF